MKSKLNSTIMVSISIICANWNMTRFACPLVDKTKVDSKTGAINKLLKWIDNIIIFVVLLCSSRLFTGTIKMAVPIFAKAAAYITFNPVHIKGYSAKYLQFSCIFSSIFNVLFPLFGKYDNSSTVYILRRPLWAWSLSSFKHKVNTILWYQKSMSTALSAQ